MKALFQHFNSAEQYVEAGIKYCEPMTAKEIEDVEEQDRIFQDPDYFIEEKLDGTRCTMHFFDDYSRLFSRRVSAKTGWFVENSDSVPHLRDIAIPSLAGTIIDGEMKIPGREFSDVAATLNCKWDKAVERQEELGKIVFNAFDILYYKGIKVEKMPLSRRKVFLERVIKEVNSPYLHLVDYQQLGGKIDVSSYEGTYKTLKQVKAKIELFNLEETYSNLYEELCDKAIQTHMLYPRAFYEYIVAVGGEGVMVKPAVGKYWHKRGKEYLKVKKFLTKDVIIMGFTKPTREYHGKFPDDRWSYWEDENGDKVHPSTASNNSAKSLKKKGWVPVTKYWFENWVGNIRYGVLIHDDEIEKLPKNKKFNVEKFSLEGVDIGSEISVLEVGDCAGFDETMRNYFTQHQDELVGSVIEVKANEIFKDTGKLRHPRFLRMREDKSPIQCTWQDHIGG